MSETTPSFQIIKKPVRTGNRRVKAANMKPAEAKLSETDDNHEFFCVYVSNGKEIKRPCSHDIYKRVMGPTPKKGQPSKWLDMQVGLAFIIHHNKENQVVGIDVMPDNRFDHGMVPANQEGIDYVEVVVNQLTGELRVTAIPPKVSEKTVEAILAGIDEVEEIHPHDHILSKYEVTSVSGNTLRVSPFTE
jgi:hypothetical protein